ncbi:MAG TPA: hypothetical protein VK176_12955 [Phycisphaerales bacterium]|nr:hypothetical protein [Phycisphaerales bacterium]
MFRTTTTIAAVFGLTAFAVSVIAGLASGIPGPTILGRAIVCMLGCYAVGLFAGRIGEFVASDYIKLYKDAAPILDDASIVVTRGGGAGAAPTSAGGKDVAEGSSVAMV